MNHSKIIKSTVCYIESHFEQEGSGHDWRHICRVRSLAKSIAAIEGGDLFIVEMASLLHDLDDWKISVNSSVSLAEEWLRKSEVIEKERNRIMEVVSQVSFKGAGVDTTATSVEAKIVQDADRLDAIGAIGVARAFAYGGNKGRLIYNPGSRPVMHTGFEDYKGSNTDTINHFYEKLLLLRDRMQTKTGRDMAGKRHRFLEIFLKEFFLEWEGKN